MAASRSRSRPAGAIATMPPSVQCARASPAPAATSDSRRLSATSCRTRRDRPAPSAERMANSRLRSMPLARSRLATFAQPMPRTSTTAPNISTSGSRTPPIRCSRSGTTTALLVALVRGCSLASAAEIVSISLWACSTVTPGARRATTFHQALARMRFSYSWTIFGVQTASSPGRGRSCGANVGAARPRSSTARSPC